MQCLLLDCTSAYTDLDSLNALVNLPAQVRSTIFQVLLVLLQHRNCTSVQENVSKEGAQIFQCRYTYPFAPTVESSFAVFPNELAPDTCAWAEEGDGGGREGWRREG